MAASMVGRAGPRCCRLFILSRHYSTQPPVFLGGKVVTIPSRKGEDLELVKSLEERLHEEGEKYEPDPAVNIGVNYSAPKHSPSEFLKVSRQNRRNKELEQASRHNTLQVPLKEVREGWKSELGPSHTMRIARHYGIYRDLFNGAFFYPVVDLNVAFEFDDETVTPVHRGNLVPPGEAQSPPLVHFEAEQDSFWTLLMVNPDGHLTNNESEYLHWFVANIPGGDIEKGQEICDYLPPFPTKGTGFHRYVFLLLKQDGQMNYDMTFSLPERSLEARTFKTCEFYRKHSDKVTPMGLSFFQSEHDKTVRNVFHNVLDMKEPVFEYKYPPPYHPPQVRYPHKEPFDRYYDRYRDKKDLAEEVMKMKLDMISPFKPYTQEWKYPLVSKARQKMPTWLKKRTEMMERRREQFQDLPVEDK